MCGHLGMIGPGIVQKDLDIFKQLGIVSQLRGRDGAGVYQVKSCLYSKHAFDYEDYYKSAWNFSTLLDEIDGVKKYKDLMKNVSVDLVMGHVRAATHGFVNDVNSHPYMFPTFVCAHNGTLKDEKYTKHPTKTDSEMMFADVVQRGMETVFNELNRDSAFACVMYNKVDNKLYFVRNELRTLAFAFLEDRGVMYWASELDMLKFILDRNGEKGKYKVYNLRPNVIIKLKANEVTIKAIEEDPLSIFEVHGKLNRQLPTVWQKALDEQNKKKAAKEAAELRKAELDKVFQQQGEPPRVNNVLAFPKVEDKETKKELVVVDPTTGRFTVKTLYCKCKCGAVSLNLLEAHTSMKGSNPKVRYNHTERQHYCTQCTQTSEHVG